jgi:hypothetical protein
MPVASGVSAYKISNIILNDRLLSFITIGPFNALYIIIKVNFLFKLILNNL